MLSLAYSAVPARYSKGPLFRKSATVFQKSIVQIRAPVLTFGLRVGLGLALELESALELGLGLVGIVDFQNSEPSEQWTFGISNLNPLCRQFAIM